MYVMIKDVNVVKEIGSIIICTRIMFMLITDSNGSSEWAV